MGEVRVALDYRALAQILAGGEVELRDHGIVLIPGQDIFRVTQRVRTREHGGRIVAAPTPKKEQL